MKAILKSLVVIGLVAGLAIGATRAFFSDTETKVGNVFIAGTIDIAVNGENPWSTDIPYMLDDMKPSETEYITFTVKNVGTNPVRIWKHIKDVTTEDNGVNEPECEAYGGDWSGSECSGGTVRNDIDTVIEYDLYVNDQPIISEDDGITISDIESAYIDLGEFLTDKQLQPDEEITVKQSYHMRGDTGNWAQSDKMTFTIELLAQQVNAPEVTSTVLLMENKDTNYNIIKGDGTWGVLTFNASGSVFNYNFNGHGLKPSTSYSLIYYADPWPGNHPGALIGMMTTNANGDVSNSGSPDLGMDLPDPADANYPGGAKIWLVPSSDYDEGTKSLTGWHPDQYLFEYNLIKYDDTNAP